MARLSMRQILSLLDRSADPWFHAFPDFALASWLVDVRLSVYRDGPTWCLLIEVVEVDTSSPGHLGVRTILYPIATPPGFPELLANHNILILTSDGGGASTFRSLKRKGEFANPRAAVLRLRDRVIKLPKTVDYARSGIDLRSLPYIHNYELMRCLASQHDSLFFATESEIRERVPAVRCDPILRLRQWRHPRILDGEAPSKTETFKMLAKVIVTGDPSHYRPTEDSNTHWSCWPDPEDV